MQIQQRGEGISGLELSQRYRVGNFNHGRSRPPAPATAPTPAQADRVAGEIRSRGTGPARTLEPSQFFARETQRRGPRRPQVVAQGLPAVFEYTRRLRAGRAGGRLDLAGLGLREAPEALLALKGLRELRLDGNGIASLPEHLCWAVPGLARLAVRGNQLAGLPGRMELMTALTSLDVGANRLRALPVELGLLTGLGSLAADGNPVGRMKGGGQKVSKVVGRRRNSESA